MMNVLCGVFPFLFRRIKQYQAVRPLYTVRTGRQETVALCDTLEDAERSMGNYRDAMLYDIDGACLSR